MYDELTSRTYPGQRVDTYVYDEDLDLESSGTIAVSHQPGDVKTIDFSNEFGKLLKKVQYCIGKKRQMLRTYFLMMHSGTSEGMSRATNCLLNIRTMDLIGRSLKKIYCPD